MDSNNLTLEDLGRKGYKMYQLKDGFRFGTDTVLLAWFTASFVKGPAPVKMLELGANCGAATLLVSARKESVSIDALEIDADACEVLRKNIELNSLGDIMRAHEGDVRELPDDIRRGQYDLVFMNPPFFKPGTGPSSDSNKPGKLQGRFENNGSLEDFISAVEETVYQNPKTHESASSWKRRFLKAYEDYCGVRLSIPRWDDIAENYQKK